MIKCAYCSSEDVDYIDEADRNIESYYCNKCNEYFYVETITSVVEIRVSKDKYKNYKTIYKLK